MNRHDRRKQRALERKLGRKLTPEQARALERKLGRKLTPEQARAVELGLRSGQNGEVPPRYMEDIRKLARAMLEWINLQPRRPELHWHDMTETETLLVAPLSGDALKYLAGSPDAIRMLEWVDERTGGVGTLYQATWALKLIGQLPGLEDESKGVSAGLQDFQAFAAGATRATRFKEPMACPHCGELLDGASNRSGHAPSPGAHCVCVYCGGIGKYDEALHPVAMTEAEFQALPADLRARLEDASALFRQARASFELGGHGTRKVPEA